MSVPRRLLALAEHRRCFPQEALEEAADGLAYAAVALMRGRDGGTTP